MMFRTTLNARPPHTLRDATRDPFDWLEGPSQSERSRMTLSRLSAAAARALAAAAILAVVLLIAACGGEGCSDDCADQQNTKTTQPPPCDTRPEVCA